MLKLYQFPISHFCEKARWALEIKELPYRKVNLSLLSHAKKTKKIAPKSTVPILEHDGHYIQQSDAIITYLDDRFSRRKLTPEDSNEAKLAEAWESFADREIGPAVRLLCYHTLLEHRDLVVPLMTQDGTWYSSSMTKFVFPKMVAPMREFMKINDATAQEAEEKISNALDNLVETIGDKEFLVGDTFTRADLSVAAMLAPLFMPEGFGINCWPKEIPEPLAGQISRLNDRLGWAQNIYDNFR